MAGEQLQVSIGADVSGLQRGLAKATRQLDSFKLSNKALEAVYKSGKLTSEQYYNAIAKNSIRLQTASNNINKYKRDIVGLGTSAITGGKGIETLNKSTANAVPTLTSFSQVIQDAPYGIRGVANNITQLTSQFGYLSKSTGSAKAALSSMLGTLAGPAGILLAVSAVTSLMVSYGDKLKFAASASSKLAKASAELVASAKTEITTLTTLLAIARDANTSYGAREKAVDEINKKYSKYLGNLDLDSIKTDKVTKSVNQLTVALLQKAKVQGLEELIKETSKDKSEALIKANLDQAEALKVLNAEVKRTVQGNKVLREELGNIKEPRELLKAYVALTQQQGIVGDVARQTSTGVGIALASFKAASNQTKELSKDLDDALKPLVSLQTQFKKSLFETEVGIIPAFSQEDVLINVKVDPDKVKASFNLIETLNNRTNELLSKNPVTIPTEGILESFGVIGNGVRKLSETYGTALTEIEERTARLANFSVEIGQLISSGIAGIGEAIGAALINGANIANALGGALLNAVGSIAVELGKQAIAIGVGMIAIKKAFANPATAIAAGVALVAIGSAIKATANTVSGVGNGSTYSGSSGNNQTTSYGSSSVSSGAFEGRVIFEIGGDKLIGVLNNTSLGNLRVGDSDQLITTG